MAVVLCCLALTACDEQLQELVDASNDVTAVVCIRRNLHNAHLCGKITDAKKIRSLAEGIAVEEEVPMGEGTFMHQMVFLRDDLETASISFGSTVEGEYCLRYRERAYRLDETSYDMLRSCYAEFSGEHRFDD